MTNDTETPRRGQRSIRPITLADLVEHVRLADVQGISRADYARSLGLSEDALSLFLKTAERNPGLAIEQAKKIFGTR